MGDTDGLITLYLNIGTNSSPVLSSSGFIQSGSTNLDVGARAAPVVVDWNNDGKKDLLIGNDLGFIRLYLNSGTDSSPVFTTFTNLMKGSLIIRHPRSCPEVFDLNYDGKKDLIIGDWTGYFHFYRNTGTDDNPTFFSSDTLLINSIPPRYVYVDQSAKFDLADWDEDGDMDLISGDWFAFVNYFKNVSPPFNINDNAESYWSGFSLKQNYPNPFNPLTTISFTLPISARVRISIFSITGQHLTTLVDEQKTAGTHSIQWNAGSMTSGVYFYQLTVGDFSEVKKCIILR